MNFATFALALVLISSACTTYPTSPDELTAMNIRLASEAASHGDGGPMVDYLRSALIYPNAEQKVKEFFVRTPKAKEVLKTYLDKLVDDANQPFVATYARERVAIAEHYKLLSERELAELARRLREIVTAGNLNGALQFTLADKLSAFPELATAEHQKVIVDRTITKLQSKNQDRPVRALMDYVSRSGGRNSLEGHRVELLLPTLNLRLNELGAIGDIYPEFAARQRDVMTLKATLQVKNADRLFADDVLLALRPKSEAIKWAIAADATTTTIIVERVRNEERTRSERSETITYATYDVNLLAAAMLMPRNSSFLYDVVSGGREIEYGYVVSAHVDGRMVDEKVVRGTVSGVYRRCQNSRIQNVFGGVSKADFIANDDMQKRCSGSPAFSMSELRSDVITKVADAVFSLAPVKAIVD